MEFILPGLISFLITLAAIPPTIRLTHKFNLLDHQRVVPRAGGLPVFIGLTLSVLIFTPILNATFGILSSLLILLFLGLLDDKRKNLSPYLRLVGQFMAAAVVVVSGVSINFITNPFGGIIHLDIIPYLSQILATLWIVWVMNMINWSKGVDGQMPGVVAVAAFILGLLALKLHFLQDPSQAYVAKLSFITAGSALGLLLFNWYPAKIFPGFSGSTILGFMIAVLAILSGAKLATAGLVLLIPAADFFYTFLRRILQGKSPVWGDRGHLHHRLLEQGFTHRQISLFYILGSVILGAAALSLTSSGKLFAAGLLGAMILGGILWLNFFGELLKQRAPDNG